MLIKRILSAGAVSAVGMLMQVLLFVVAGAVLAVDDFSHFTLIMGYSVLVSQLVSLGFAQVSTRLIAVGEAAAGSAYIVNLVFIVLVIPAAFAYLDWRGSLVLMLFCLKFLNKRVLMSGDYGASLVFLDEFLWIIPSFVSLFLSSGYLFFLDVLIFGLFVSVLVQLSIVSFRGWGGKVDVLAFLKLGWKSSFFITVFLSGRLVANRLDIFVVSERFSNIDFSAFSLAHRVSYVATFVPLVVAVVMSGRVAALFSEGRKTEIKRLLLWSCGAAFLTTSLGILLFVFAGGFVLGEYASGRYEGYFLLFLIMILAQGAISLSGVSQMILVMAGRERYISLLVFSLCVLMYLFLMVFNITEVVGVAVIYLVFSVVISFFSFIRAWSLLGR